VILIRPLARNTFAANSSTFAVASGSAKVELERLGGLDRRDRYRGRALRCWLLERRPSAVTIGEVVIAVPAVVRRSARAARVVRAQRAVRARARQRHGLSGFAHAETARSIQKRRLPA
jgi:hypothetical protein